MSLGLFGPIGTPELLIILVIALVLFGGRLPEVARSLGKSMNQFKRGLKEVDDELERPDPPAAPPDPPRSLPSPPQPVAPREPTQARDEDPARNAAPDASREPHPTPQG